jgi:hypothetical protein
MVRPLRFVALPLQVACTHAVQNRSALSSGRGPKTRLRTIAPRRAPNRALERAERPKSDRRGGATADASSQICRERAAREETPLERLCRIKSPLERAERGEATALADHPRR